MSTTQLISPRPAREAAPAPRNRLVALPNVGTEPGSKVDPYWTGVVIRPAVAADAVLLGRLAQLDSARPPAGAVVIAEQRGSVVAAVSLDDGTVIANPFVATAEIVELLRLRAAQLRRRGAKPAA